MDAVSSHATKDTTMRLHTFPLSGHAHRAHLFLSLIGAEFELVQVDLAGGAHKTAEFLKLNPFGQVPVLEDGDVVVSDSNGIMVYLAKKHGKTEWLPEGAVEAAQVQRWLSVAAGELAYGSAAARLVTVFGAKRDPDEVIGRGHALLKILQDLLARQDWLVAGRPTIADVALYSYTARAPEGNVDLEPYPAVRQWLARVEALPGFVPFARTPAGLAA
jgi:glutathione S-transferase